MEQELDLRKKYDEKMGVVVTYDRKGNPKVNFPVSNFPSPQFEKWDADCKVNFSDCRWAKMVNDHEKAKMYDLLILREATEVREETVESNHLNLIGGGILEKNDDGGERDGRESI